MKTVTYSIRRKSDERWLRIYRCPFDGTGILSWNFQTYDEAGVNPIWETPTIECLKTFFRKVKCSSCQIKSTFTCIEDGDVDPIELSFTPFECTFSDCEIVQRTTEITEEIISGE